MKENILIFDLFVNEFHEECKNAEWFPAVVEDSYSLDTEDTVVSALIGEIHEGLRVDYDEAVKYFWTILLINPLIAIKAYQETDLLLGEIDLYGVFKSINLLAGARFSAGLYDSEMKLYNSKVIFNPSAENFMIFAMEALLQKNFYFSAISSVVESYLEALYAHDKNIMVHKNNTAKEQQPKKWLNHRNLKHILDAIDPHRIIVLLSFFTEKYKKRMHAGMVFTFSFSGDKYNYIIHYIKRRYGSLSEYIEWRNGDILGYYRNYYIQSLEYNELLNNLDVVFPTNEDKERIKGLVNAEN